MTSFTAFHSQLTSIMEALTKAAVAEICELVDDSYAVLQLEISRSHKENEALRRKLELIETIIARGHRGNVALLGYGGGQEAAGGGPLDFTVERALPSGAGIKQLRVNLKRSERIHATEATTAPTPAAKEPRGQTEDSSTVAAEEPDSQDVVLIKEETPKEEPNDGDDAAADELLFKEDGERGA